MAGKKGSTRRAVEAHLEEVEEMLAIGLPSNRIEVSIARKYALSRRQVRRYIATIDERWDEQTEADAPHLRGRVYRQMQRFYTKSLAEGKYTAAVQALALLAKYSGAFARRSELREQLLEELGPPPTDPNQTLPYARRMLVFELREVFGDAALPPSERLRIMSDLAAKLGMIFSRSDVEDAVKRIEEKLDGRKLLTGSAKVVDASTIVEPATARGGGRTRGPRPVRGPGARPRPGKDEGDDPPGGKPPLGSA